MIWQLWKWWRNRRKKEDTGNADRLWNAFHKYPNRRIGFFITAEDLYSYFRIKLDKPLERLGREIHHALETWDVIPESAILFMIALPIDRWGVQIVFEDNHFPEVREACAIEFKDLPLGRVLKADKARL